MTMKTKNKETLLPLIPPGEILLEEFLKPMEISVYKLAKDIGVSRARMNDIALGRRTITPDTAIRLSRYFGTSAEFWLNLQIAHDLEKLEREGSVPEIAPCAMAA